MSAVPFAPEHAHEARDEHVGGAARRATTSRACSSETSGPRSKVSASIRRRRQLLLGIPWMRGFRRVARQHEVQQAQRLLGAQGQDAALVAHDA